MLAKIKVKGSQTTGDRLHIIQRKSYKVGFNF